MKQTQINKIEWKEINLSDICSVDSGQGAPQGDKYFLGEEIFVRAGDLNKLTEIVFVGDFCEKITKEAIEKYKLRKFKKNSIVFPKSGMSIKTDNIALLKYDSYVVNHLAILECKEINPKFLFYYLKKNKISNLCNDTSYPSIRISDINNYRVSLPFSNGSPDLKEQERIVKILEESEKLNEKGKRADELLDEYLKSVFYEMFGDPQFQESKFEKMPFLKAIEKEASNNKLKIQQKDFLEEGKYPIIDQGEKFIAGYTNDSSKIYSDKFPVIIFGDHTRALKFVKFPFALGADGVKILVPSKEFNPLYFYYCLKLLELPSAGYSRHYKFLKGKDIPLPPLPLQQKFASIVEQVEKMRDSINKTKQNSEELFNSLVSKGFRGEL